MFIGLCGLKYSGRKSLSNFLRDDYNFTIVLVTDEPSPPGNEKILHFVDVDTMLNWVSERWRDDFVWPEVEKLEDFEKVGKRPFFALMEVKSKISDRFKRCGCGSLDELLREDDLQAFRGDGLLHLSQRVKFTFANTGTLAQLRCSLRKLNLTDSEQKNQLTRPNWDSYFMQIAEFAAQRTNCMKRGVGAVLVQEKRIIATGYNGTARGLNNCSDGGCGRCNSNTKCGQALDLCLCLHAEENALLEAGRSRSSGSTLYCTTAPCLSCARKICQMAVARVVYARDYSVEHFTARLCKEAGILLEKFEGTFASNSIISCEDFDDSGVDASIDITNSLSAL